MTPITHKHGPAVDRRTVLRGAGATALALSMAGCVDSVLPGSDSASDDVVLDPPEGYDRLREDRDDGVVPYPIHGDELPDVSAPCALSDETVRTTDFIGERHTLYTFVFARCPGACPVLTSSLVHAQVKAIENGYEDEIACVPVTFDPEYDTRDVLERYSEERGAVVDDGSWYFLRPETTADAQELVEERFGVHFEPLSDEQREEMDMHEDMAFTHDEAIVLANANGYVERTYFGTNIPSTAELLDDLETLRERWE